MGALTRGIHAARTIVIMPPHLRWKRIIAGLFEWSESGRWKENVLNAFDSDAHRFEFIEFLKSIRGRTMHPVRAGFLVGYLKVADKLTPELVPDNMMMPGCLYAPNEYINQHPAGEPLAYLGEVIGEVLDEIVTI